MHVQTECDAGKLRGSQKGIASKCDFQRIHSNGLALSIKPFTINTRTVARRDLNLAPILAAFAQFLLEESAIAERRREQDYAPATDREHKPLISAGSVELGIQIILHRR